MIEEGKHMAEILVGLALFTAGGEVALAARGLFRELRTSRKLRRL